MEISPILVVVLLVSLPLSSARQLQQQPPASRFPPPLPDDLPCPPPQGPTTPPENPYYTTPPPIGFLPPDSPFPPHPAPAPEVPPPLPEDPPRVSPRPQTHRPKNVLSPPPPPPQGPTTPPDNPYLYYSPPPPMTILPPEFPSHLQPPPKPEFSSLLSSFIVRLLSRLGVAVFTALLVTVCRKILIRCLAAPNPPVEVEMQGVHAEMEMEDLPL